MSEQTKKCRDCRETVIGENYISLRDGSVIHEQPEQCIALMKLTIDSLRQPPPPPAVRVSVDPAFEGTKCPFTHRVYMMHLDHEELGWVPTYGGPFDSYTIPVPDEDGNLYSERYDHDEGGWIEGGEPIGVMLVSDEEYAELAALRAQPDGPQPPLGVPHCPTCACDVCSCANSADPECEVHKPAIVVDLQPAATPVESGSIIDHCTCDGDEGRHESHCAVFRHVPTKEVIR